MAEQFVIICDQCGGEIPKAADQIRGVQGQLQQAGVVTPFPSLDFCCTAHMFTWLQAQPVVATPNPLYGPPPALP